MQPNIPGTRIQRLIGQGACGEVWHGVRDGGALCAIKVLDTAAINHEYLTYCFQKVGSLPPNPRLVPLYDFQPDDVQTPPYYSMALFTERREADGSGPAVGRTLERRCGKVSRETAWRWIFEVAEGMAFLHKHAVVHCSLKPSNIFVGPEPEMSAMISDFGQGWLAGVEALALSDHVFYCPPEHLREPTQIQFGIGEKWDVYAFGVTAFRLLTGRFPRGQEFAPRLDNPQRFGDVPDPFEFADAIEQQPAIEWPEPVAPNDEVEARRRMIVEQCLELDPADRWVDMREVCDALGSIEQKLAEERAWREARQERERIVADAEAARKKVESDANARQAGLRKKLSASMTAALAAAAAAVALGGTTLSFWQMNRTARKELDERNAQIADYDRVKKAEFAQLNATATGAKADASAAREAERLAKENLAGAQLTADHFFGSFLEAARQMPAGSEEERNRLLTSALQYFQKFIEDSATKPDLAVASLRARTYVAEIKATTTGGDEAATRYDEARKAIDDFLSKNPKHPDAVALAARADDCALASARLKVMRGPVAEEARNALRKALDDLSKRTAAGDAEPGIVRRQADASLLLAAALANDTPTEALDRIATATDQLNHLMVDPKITRNSDKLLLARLYFQRGLIERAQKKTDAALATHVQIAELLVQLPQEPEVDFLLARSYGESGELLDSLGERTDAARAHGEAIVTLSDLVKLMPERDEFRFHLARRYADIAQIVRDHAEPAKAIDYQKGAVEMLKELVKKEPTNRSYLVQLARKQADLADLLFGLKQRDEAMGYATESLAILDKLNEPAKASGRDWNLILDLAYAYGVVGHVTEQGQRKQDAAACFNKAVAHYQTLAAARAGDEAIERGLTWSKMRLAKLQN